MNADESGQTAMDFDGRLQREAEARDAALSRHVETKEELIREATELAVEIATRNGRVTSTEVLRALRERDAIGDRDPRFLGVVFRSKLWSPIGWADTGSHRRPVRVWALSGLTEEGN